MSKLDPADEVTTQVANLELDTNSPCSVVACVCVHIWCQQELACILHYQRACEQRLRIGAFVRVEREWLRGARV